MTVFKGGFNSVSNRAGFDRIRRAIRDNTEIGQRLKALVNSEEFVRNFGRRPENRALISGDLDPEGEVIENGSNNFWGGRNPYKSREREHYKVKVRILLSFFLIFFSGKGRKTLSFSAHSLPSSTADVANSLV